MAKQDLLQRIKRAAAAATLRKVDTIEPRKPNEPLEIVSDVEYFDLMDKQGCSRIEWRRLSVSDDLLVVHEPVDLAGLCSRCGASIHRDNIAKCAECSDLLCNRHRHAIGDSEYVCSKHYFGWLLRRMLKI